MRKSLLGIMNLPATKPGGIIEFNAGRLLARIGQLILLTAFLTFLASIEPARAEVRSLSAIPVAKGEILFGNQYHHIASKEEDPTPADFEAEVSFLQYGLSYGLTEKIALGVLIPIQFMGSEVNTPSGRKTTSAQGLGDIRAGVRYTLYQWDRPKATFRLTPYGGLKFPTGDEDERLGSGSWDPVLGTAAIYQTLTWQAEADVRYEITTEANDIERGDRLFVVLGAMHIIWPTEISPLGNLYGGIEVELIRFDKDEISGVENPLSGQLEIDIIPFLQYRVRAIKVSAYVSIPVLEDFGANLEVDGVKYGAQIIVAF